MFNRSLAEGIVPTVWKTAHVSPIHKKGNKELCTNYRPISLLSCIGKCLEKCVQQHLFDYLKTYHIITCSQSGFIPKDSTVYQLLSIYDDLCKSFDNNIVTQAISFDISKAFDRVWHRGLIRKLYAVGVRNNLLTWFQDYLRNRKQAVVLHGSISEYRNVSAGVPQGSVLGPLLFLIYINDIVVNIESTIKLFADDTSMYLSLNDYDERAEILNNDLQKITTWAETWKVTFNETKTELLNIARGRNNHYPPLYFSNTTLQAITTHKHLGIIFQNNLKWDTHIIDLISRCRTQVDCLRSYKYRLSRKALETMYKSFILPKLDYADIIWDNCSEILVDQLESVHLDAIRTIIGAVRGTSHIKLYTESGFISLKERRYRHKLILYHKIVNNNVPEYLISKLPRLVSEINPYHRRRPYERSEPNWDIDIYHKSFFPSTTRHWNDLPENIQSTDSISRLKSYLVRNDYQVPIYYYSGEHRPTQIIHCKLRNGISDLNDDMLKRHLSDNPYCQCGQGRETAAHYLLHCPRYAASRSTTIDTLPRAYINANILLNGQNNLSSETNNEIFNQVHHFISQTDRFTA